MEEGSSIIVFISHCRGIIFIIFQTTSCKGDVISVLTLFFSPRNLSSIYRAFSKTWSNCSVIQSVWLYNILVLVHYHKRNTSIKKQVNILKVKVTMTQQRSIFASAASLIFACIIGILLTIHKINRKRKPNIDLWVKRSKVNLPATLWLHFISDRISLSV